MQENWASKPSTTSPPLPAVGEGRGEGDRSSVPAACGVHLLKADKLLWQKLCARQLCAARFRKETPIGPHLVDFVSFEHKLVSRLTAAGTTRPQDSNTTLKRTAWLEDQGFRVLRFWNNQVLTNLESVLERTLQKLEGQTSPSPYLSHLGKTKLWIDHLKGAERSMSSFYASRENRLRLVTHT